MIGRTTLLKDIEVVQEKSKTPIKTSSPEELPENKKPLSHVEKLLRDRANKSTHREK